MSKPRKPRKALRKPSRAKDRPVGEIRQPEPKPQATPAEAVDPQVARATVEHLLAFRPTKYRPEFIAMMDAYFSGPLYVTGKVLVRGFMVDGTVPREFPTLEGFAHSINISAPLLYAWCETDREGNERYPGFADAVARARTYQIDLLVKGTLAGCFPERFVTFLLQNMSDMRQKAPVRDPEELDVDDAPSTADLDAVYQKALENAKRKKAEMLTERAAEVAAIKDQYGGDVQDIEFTEIGADVSAERPAEDDPFADVGNPSGESP